MNVWIFLSIPFLAVSLWSGYRVSAREKKGAYTELEDYAFAIIMLFIGWFFLAGGVFVNTFS